MPLLEILIAGPYNVALTVAAIAGGTLAYRHGRAEGQTPLAWTVLLGVALAAGLVGSKVFFFDLQPAEYGEKTILGGILLGVIAVAFVARGLGLGVRRSLDILTVPTLVAMAIGRVGCFFAGCCLGIESSALPWHLHPVTLYEAALDLVLLAIIARRVPVTRLGLRIGVGVGGYAGIRFCTEFLRAGRELHAGLNTVQWFMLLVAAIMLVYAVQTSAAVRTTAPRPRATTHGTLIAAAALLAVLISALVAPVRWLTPLEWMVLLGVATVVALGAVGAMLPAVRSWRLSSAMGALVLMQPTAQDSTPPQKALIVGASMWRGTYERLVGESVDETTGCSSPVTSSRRTGGERYSVALRTSRPSAGRVTIEGAYLTGSDRPATAADESNYPSVPVRAGGVSITSEHPRGMFRFGGVLGATSQDSGASDGSTGFATLRLRMRVGILFEGHFSPASHYGTLGDVSYVGLGFQRRVHGARVLIGTGGVFQLHVPMRDRFEFDLAHNPVFDNIGGTRRSWRIGLRHIIPLP